MSHASPVGTGSADVGEVLADVAAEDHGLDLTDALLVQDGSDHVVVTTRDEWVVRLPREDGDHLAREVAVLALLVDRLPVAVPHVAWTGRRRPMMAYRLLEGSLFSADAFLAADDDARDRLARSLAEVMAAMHRSLAPDEVAVLGVPAADLHADPDCVLAGLADAPPHLRADLGTLVAAYRAAWIEDPPEEPDVVLHGDLHLRNMALSGPAGPVTALWDFSDVRTGPPTLDLRHLTGVLGRRFPCRVGRTDLVRRVVPAYAALTGLVLDVDRAALALRMSDVADAVRSGDTHLLEQAVLSPLA